MEKEESNNSMAGGYILKPTRKRGMISEFFNHMITYGGFSFEEGVIRVWGDPSLFVPARAFVTLYNDLKKELGTEASDIFYWLGRLYGKNSTEMLLKKFGFDKKNLPDFINGATQDGFGYIEAKKLVLNEHLFEGEVTGKNSTFSISYKNLFGKQKKPIDFYLAGILAGGAEPLFNRNLICTEKKCMVMGDKNCLYSFKDTKKIETPKFFKRLPFSEEKILKKSRLAALKRKINFRFFQIKNIKFGDGSFILEGYRGFNTSVYEHVLLDKFIFYLLGKDKFNILKDKMALIYVEDTFDKDLYTRIITQQDIQRIINHIQIFGLGRLQIYRYVKNEIIIRNFNNPYAEELINLFGKNDDSSVDLLSRILKFAFEKYFGRKIKIKTIKNSLAEAYFEIVL